MGAAMSLMAHFQKSLIIMSSCPQYLSVKEIIFIWWVRVLHRGANKDHGVRALWRLTAPTHLSVVMKYCDTNMETRHFLGARTDMQPMSNLFHSAQFPDILDVVQVYLLA